MMSSAQVVSLYLGVIAMYTSEIDKSGVDVVLCSRMKLVQGLLVDFNKDIRSCFFAGDVIA